MTTSVAVLILLLVGTFQPTERSKRLERIIRRAMARVEMTLERASQEQGIDPAQFHRQLAAYLGQTPSAYRLAELPDDFQVERLKLEAPDYGLIVLERDEVGRAVEALTQFQPRMARANLAPRKKVS